MTFAAYNAGWHMILWLPNSARARIILWEYTAEQMSKGEPVIPTQFV